MEALASVIFERTPQGSVVIKSTGDEVPRRLRTLLLAVDGRSPVAQYVPFLTAFAPLSEKFVELEQMGYLRRKGGSPALPTPPLSFASGLIDMAHSLSVQAGMPATAPQDAFALELQALARQMGRSGWRHETSVTAASPTELLSHGPALVPELIAPSTSAPTLQELLAEMERFLSRAAGLDGLPIALMLEQITSLSLLRRELPSYLQLIQSYGVDAEVHGQQLTSLLEQAGP